MSQSTYQARVNVFSNEKPTEGVALILPDTIAELIENAGLKLKIPGKKLFSKLGCLVDDICVIRDNDELYLSCGEDFLRFPDLDGGWINLNVGGKTFATTISTLTHQDPDSMLARMFCPENLHQWDHHRDSHGAYLIDRSPHYFEPVLNFLRHGQIIIDPAINIKGVLEEARFFGVLSMVTELEKIMEDGKPPGDYTPLTRRDVMQVLNRSTPSPLRFQGMCLSGADLSKLDLSYINFRYANLSKANLSGANLSYAILERADLSGCSLTGANLMGVRMMCANAEGAIMINCNFEDPAGHKASLEGCNLKRANLEGSQLAGVNLRVATLKNGILRNCNLRKAVLAGADLENCDLSGCDLHEANLRGANLKNAAFELIVTPLHMAQMSVQ